ncbi:sensor histidine kinase [Lonepinella koalarum]|uniref:sensor histidine kinase n=1 Tax=Lonepinella koalarum TaxID=53417 RepID=UPI003F6DAB4D
MKFPKMRSFLQYFLRYVSVIGLLCLFFPVIAKADDWQIGILAQRGTTHTYAKWQPWVDWLNQQLNPEHHFVLVMLDLDDLKQEKAKDLDFIITNQSQFFYLNDTPVRWLVTLNSPRQQHNTIGRIGSAIIVRADSQYRTLQDLKGKKIAAVGNDAFGGFLLGYHEFVQHNLSEKHDLHFQFTGFPVDNTLFWLKEKKVDAAITPVCLLEDLVIEGVLKQQDFRLLLDKPNTIGCWASTDLLPNWSLAAMPKVPHSLATTLVTLLLNHSPAELPQWTPPLSTLQADYILRELYRHPQQNLWADVKYWLIQYQGWIIAIISFILLNYLWVSWQIHRKSKALEQVYQDLHFYQKQLAQADRLSILGEMTAGIAHEINQPLSAISMYSAGLKHQLSQSGYASQVTNKILDVLDKIIHQVDRSVKIVQNLRHWAKAKNANDKERILLHTTLQRTIYFVQQQNKQAKIQLNCDIQLQIYVCTTMLEQVVCNCLLNALQANADQIAINVQPIHTDKIQIEIVDNGSGFTQQQLDFPFVPFQSTKPDGLGLGLVICQRLIQSQGGDIQLSNLPQGSGARVNLLLPKGNYANSFSG